jgi:mannose-6-phosphate isomerase class I
MRYGTTFYEAKKGFRPYERAEKMFKWDKNVEQLDIKKQKAPPVKTEIRMFIEAVGAVLTL